MLLILVNLSTGHQVSMVYMLMSKHDYIFTLNLKVISKAKINFIVSIDRSVLFQALIDVEGFIFYRSKSF